MAGGSIQAEVLARGLDSIRVLPGATGELTFDRFPTATQLQAGADEEHLAPIRVSGGQFQAPATAGRYDFRVSSRWPEGDATWLFVVVVAAA